MGVYINKNNIIDKSWNMKKNIKRTKDHASIIFKSIENFNYTESILLGKAWDAAREYTTKVQLPILRMYIEYLELDNEACGKYARAASKLPGYEKLDEDIIINKKEKYERLLDREYNRTHPRNTMIRFYEKRIDRCERLLMYIEDFCCEVHNIFAETLSVKWQLYSLHDNLKMISIDERTNTMVGPVDNENIKSILKDLEKYYAEIKEKDLLKRQKELNDLYTNYGARAVIENVLNYPEEKRLYSDIEKEDYIMLAKVLMESRGEAYISNIKITLTNCYDFEKALSDFENDMPKVSYIYEKNDKMDKVRIGLSSLIERLNKDTAITEIQNKKVRDDRQNLMQLTQAFLSLCAYEHRIVIEKVALYESDADPVKINVSRDSKNNLEINFIKYAEGFEGNANSEGYKDTSVIVSNPKIGEYAGIGVSGEGWDYAEHGLEIDKTKFYSIGNSIGKAGVTIYVGKLGENLGKMFTGMGGIVLGELGDAYTVMGCASEIEDILSEKDQKIFYEGKSTSELWLPVNKFNLGYVSSWTRENVPNGEKDYNINTFMYTIYPSYTVDVYKGVKPTTELIDICNKNLSMGGRLEEYAVELGYDGSNPITEDNICGRLYEVKNMIKGCNELSDKYEKGIDIISEE
jgi:hypothetical protein